MRSIRWISTPIGAYLVASHTKPFHTEALFCSSVVLSNSAVRGGRSLLTMGVGFVGAFIVSSLAIQLVRTYDIAATAGPAAVEPVIPSPATLWAPFGER